VLGKIAHKFSRLKNVLEGGYRNTKLKEMSAIHLDVNLKSCFNPTKELNVIPLRWIVERTIVWLFNFRGLPWTTSSTPTPPIP
jgi:hypothetical protein